MKNGMNSKINERDETLVVKSNNTRSKKLNCDDMIAAGNYK